MILHAHSFHSYKPFSSPQEVEKGPGPDLV
jgi:hypothetical protein